MLIYLGVVCFVVSVGNEEFKAVDRYGACPRSIFYLSETCVGEGCFCVRPCRSTARTTKKKGKRGNGKKMTSLRSQILKGKKKKRNHIILHGNSKRVRMQELGSAHVWQNFCSCCWIFVFVFVLVFSCRSLKVLRDFLSTQCKYCITGT